MSQKAAIAAYAYKKSNRWRHITISVPKIGVLFNVFDIVTVNYPKFNLENIRGRIFKITTDPKTLVSTIEVELAVKVGTSVEDPAYWQGPTLESC